jgi:hypothetical protein
VLHEREEPILQKSIAEARRAGYLQNRKLRVALDTTPILGKGAVKDTYNLLGEGIERLGRRLAEVEKVATAAQASVRPTNVFLAALSTFWARFLRLIPNPDLGAAFGAG